MKVWDWTQRRQKSCIIKRKDGLSGDFTEIVVKNTILEKKYSILKYLGSIKSSDGTCLRDVMAMTVMAKLR